MVSSFFFALQKNSVTCMRFDLIYSLKQTAKQTMRVVGDSYKTSFSNTGAQWVNQPHVRLETSFLNIVIVINLFKFDV